VIGDGQEGQRGIQGNDRKNERKDRRVGDSEALHAAREKEAKQGNEDVVEE